MRYVKAALSAKVPGITSLTPIALYAPFINDMCMREHVTRVTRARKKMGASHIS